MDGKTAIDVEFGENISDSMTITNHNGRTDVTTVMEEADVSNDVRVTHSEEMKDERSDLGIDKPDRVYAYCEDTLSNRRMVIAGGFLDIALFTSNCEQLNFVLETKVCHNYFILVLSSLVLSLILQVFAAAVLFVLGCHIIRNPTDQRRSNILNHLAMGMVALITILNIFTSTFSIKGTVIINCINR